MYTIKDASHFNLENFPYDCPYVVYRDENNGLVAFGRGQRIGKFVDSNKNISNYLCIYCWNVPPEGRYGDTHYIKLDNNNNPESYIVLYGD